jgi:hypothetical protein
LPLAALFLFIVVFASIVIRTLRRRPSDAARVVESMPLVPDAEARPSREERP